VHHQPKPNGQVCLAETGEDQAIRRAFQLWKRKIKPPQGAWEAIAQRVSQLESAKKTQIDMSPHED
jgi:hypothetical protein